MIKKIIRLINPSCIISKLRYKFSDRYVISQQWKKYRMSYPLDLNNPQTFNEKIQWLKLNDRNPLYTTLVDKIKVKEWVAEKIGVEYIIPTLAVYKSVEEIDINVLPNKFVLKCNHDSGSVIICRDIKSFDLKSAKHNLNICLKRNFYSNYREWAYKNVKPRILAEKFIELSSDDTKMIDYKFYCFNGEPKFLYVSKGLDEHGLAKMDFLKLDWTLAPFYREDYNRFDVIPAKPQCLDKLIKLSKILSNNIPFVRVDWYVIEDKPYFSEMTFYPGGHPIKLTPNDYDKEIGSWLKID